MNLLISLQNITKYYNRNKQNEVIALRNVSLTVREGDFVAVMGPSGSGKSTLLHILEGIETADSGLYLYNGIDMTHASDKARARIRNLKMGVIFQDYGLLGDSSVYRNLCIPGLIAGTKNRIIRQKAMEVMEELDIAGLAKKKTGLLSGGQQQRVAIGRAMMSDAEILFADEPTGALDHENGIHIMEILTELNRKGTTIILVTHDERLTAYAGTVIRLSDGNITEYHSKHQ